MQRLSYREYELWRIWLAEEWDNPSLTDYYLMQIACEVRRSFVKHPNQVKMKEFLLGFGQRTKNSTTSTMTTEQYSKMAKGVWVSRMTMPVKVVEVPPSSIPDQ